MLSRILIFIITATITAPVFYDIELKQGATEYKEKVKKQLKEVIA